MLGFVALIFVVSVLSHDRFLKSEMGCDPGEDFSEELRDARRFGPVLDMGMQAVDKIDKFPVLVIDFGNSGLEFFAPFNE
jgi:hypothetical protein